VRQTVEKSVIVPSISRQSVEPDREARLSGELCFLMSHSDLFRRGSAEFFFLVDLLLRFLEKELNQEEDFVSVPVALSASLVWRSVNERERLALDFGESSCLATSIVL